MSRTQRSSASPPTTTTKQHGQTESATSMCGLDSDGKLCVHPSSNLAPFHQMMQELSQSHSVTSRNKIVALGDEAIRHCGEDASIVARYMSLFIITSEARMKLPAIFICDHIIRSAKRAITPDAYASMLKAFERHLPAMYYYAKSAAAESAKSAYEIEKIEKCFRIWQDKPYFPEAIFYEATGVWELSQLIQSYKFVSSSAAYPDLISADAVARLMFRYKNLATLISSSGLTPGDKLRNLEAFVRGSLQLATLEPKSADDDSLETNMRINLADSSTDVLSADSAASHHPSSVSGAISNHNANKTNSDFGHISPTIPQKPISRRVHAGQTEDTNDTSPTSSGTGGNRSSGHGRTKPNRASNVIRSTLGEVFDYSSDEDNNKTPGSVGRRTSTRATAAAGAPVLPQPPPPPPQQQSLAERFKQIASSTPSMLLSNRLNLLANQQQNSSSSVSGNDVGENRYYTDNNSVQQQQHAIRPDLERQYKNMSAEIAATTTTTSMPDDQHAMPLSSRNNEQNLPFSYGSRRGGGEERDAPQNDDGFNGNKSSRRQQFDDVTAALGAGRDAEERRLYRLGQQQHLPSTSSARNKRSHSRSRTRSRSPPGGEIFRNSHATNAEPPKILDGGKLSHIDHVTRTTSPPTPGTRAYADWPHKPQHVTLYTRTVWLGHLPKRAAPPSSNSGRDKPDDLEQEIRSRLRRYGEIESLNLIQARGCCYVVFQRRSSAEDLLSSRSSDDFYISKQKIKLAWSPNKGWSDFLTANNADETMKKSFNVDDGLVHVPLSKIITPGDTFGAQKVQEVLDQLSQGGIVDYRTLAAELSAQNSAGDSTKPAVSRNSVVSNDGMEIDAAENQQQTAGGSAISTIIGGTSAVNQQQQQQQQQFAADSAMLLMMRGAPPPNMMALPPEVQQQMLMAANPQFPGMMPHFGQFPRAGDPRMMPGGGPMPPHIQQPSFMMQQKPPGFPPGGGQMMPPNTFANGMPNQQQFGGPWPTNNSGGSSNDPQQRFGGPALLRLPPNFPSQGPPGGGGPQQIRTLGSAPNSRPPLLPQFMMGRPGEPPNGGGGPPRFLPPFSMRPPFNNNSINNNNSSQNDSSPSLDNFNNVDRINEVENMMNKQRSFSSASAGGDASGSGGSERKRRSRFDDDDGRSSSHSNGSERSSAFRDEGRQSTPVRGGAGGGRFQRGGPGAPPHFMSRGAGGGRGRGDSAYGRSDSTDRGGFGRGGGRGGDGPSRFPRGGPPFGQHRPVTPGGSDSEGEHFMFNARGGGRGGRGGSEGGFRGAGRGGRGGSDCSPDKMRGGSRGRGGGDFHSASPFGRGGRGGGSDRGRGGGAGLSGDPAYNFPAPPRQLLDAAAAAAFRAGDDPNGCPPPRGGGEGKKR